MSDSMINELAIQNFKSIQHLTLKPRRINLFVGNPNTGKSNLLEALSLFSVLPQGDLRDFIRFEKLRHLFYDGNVKKSIEVSVKNGEELYSIQEIVTVSKQDEGFIVQFKSVQKIPHRANIVGATELVEQSSGKAQISDQNTTLTFVRSRFKFKKYSFRKAELSRANASLTSLQVPFGQNIYDVIETNPSLFEEVASLFDRYGLSLVLNQENESLLTQKKIGHRVFQLPYSLVADTLQRMIFYLAAVKTNTDSILIFEEPETHSFPPYISQLATSIAESKSNQFFIATHSPYLFNTIIEETPKEEVAVFVVDYENHQTLVHSVPESDYGEIIDYGIDIFFNIRRFTEKEIKQ